MSGERALPAPPGKPGKGDKIFGIAGLDRRTEFDGILPAVSNLRDYALDKRLECSESPCMKPFKGQFKATPKGLTLMEIMAYFSSEEKARLHLESINWPTGPVCPKCGT